MPEDDRLHQHHEEHAMILLLGRIDGQLDAAIARLEAHEQRITNLDSDVGGLRNWRAYTIGIATVISLVVATIGDRVFSLFTRGAP